MSSPNACLQGHADITEEARVICSQQRAVQHLAEFSRTPLAYQQNTRAGHLNALHLAGSRLLHRLLQLPSQRPAQLPSQLLSVLFFLIMVCMPGALLHAQDNNTTWLSSDTHQSSEGYFVLSWTLPADIDTPARLQQALSNDFNQYTEYEVAATGRMTLSGLADGDYYFRVGERDNWSETLTVSVHHHSLARAFGFFGTGLLLFVLLIAIILRGNYLHGIAGSPGSAATEERSHD